MKTTRIGLAIGTLTIAAVALLGQGPGGPGGGSGRGGAFGGSGGRGRGSFIGFTATPVFEKDPPVLPADLKPGGVLIFSKTNGFRDDAAIQASNAALVAIAVVRNLPVFVTENGAIMNPEQLAKFKLVIWNNASGDVLTDGQKAAFKAWMENGGSWLGTHGAGGDPAGRNRSSLADWKWYIDSLVGAQFLEHPRIQPVDIHIEDTKSPITKGLPAVWHRDEEVYAFAESPRRKPTYHILATVDEKSYDAGQATMPGDHPLIWWHCVDKGHAVFSALGHSASFYTEPLMIRLLDNAMAWGIAENGQSCAAGK